MEFQREYDVVVAGAGVAGVAAAVQAARAGQRVALVEKTVFCGGLATTGLIYVYLPLCDGRGRQVLFGLAEELFRRSVLYGPGGVPAGWPGGGPGAREKRFLTHFNPASFTLALDEMLLAEGVDLWLDTLVCQTIVRDGRAAGIEVENKSGRGQLLARCLVDATGDADVAHRAGCRCAEGDNWLSIWALSVSLDAARKAVAEGSGEPLLSMAFRGGDNMGNGHPADSPKWRGTDGRQVTRFLLESRRILREHFQSRQDRGQSTWETAYPITLPSMAQFRTTRRVLGRASMLPGEAGLRREDSVGLTGDWRQAAGVWEIPYGSLVPAEGPKGILTAGRCIDSSGDAWEVTRVIPPAAHTGQVAGLAAAICCRQDTTPDALDPSAVQHALHELGIPLHEEDLREPLIS